MVSIGYLTQYTAVAPDGEGSIGLEAVVKIKQPEYKYLVAALYAVALFMDLLDTTVVNVALPDLSRTFRVQSGIEWVVTGYLLSLAVFIPVSGWAGDRFGTKRTFQFAFCVFTIGSLACSLAPSFDWLVAARVLQGVGGGMLTPVGATMLYRAFSPQERARVASIIMVPAVLAPACGPIVGGYLIQAYDWRAIFWLNLPVGILGLAFGTIFLREQREESAGRFDLPGFVLGGAGLAAVLYALARAGDHGFGDGQVVAIGLAGLASAAAFVVVELRQPQPMLDLRLFSDSLFRSGNSVQFFGFGAQFGTLFLLPLLLQSERGMSPLGSGLATFPQAVGVMTMAPLAGKLYRRMGPRRMSFVGLLVGSLATLAFLRVDLTTSLWEIRTIMLVRGWGFALTLIAMQAATFATLSSSSMGRGTAIYSVARQVGTSLAIAVLATVLVSQLGAHDAVLGSPASRDGAVAAFHDAFLAATVIGALGLALTLLVDDRKAAITMQDAKHADVGLDVSLAEAELA